MSNLSNKDMYNEEIHGFCHEFYTVEKTIEVNVKIYGQDRQMRIEALKNEVDGKYSTIAYLEEDVTLQSTFPYNGEKFNLKPRQYSIWVKYHYLPWTNTKTADLALHQALGFLKEQCSD